MASRFIPAFVALLLGCVGAALTIVRRYNPALHGLGWLALAFGSGAAGAIFLLSEHQIFARSSTGIAELLVLLAFVLLQIAVLDLVGSSSIIPLLGFGLLLIQAGISLGRIHAADDDRFGIAIAGLLVAIQMAATASRLFQISRRGERVPARFTASILLCLVGVNLCRSIAALSSVLGEASTFRRVEESTYTAYLAAALGIAFGFFWTATTIRANGLEHLASTDPLTRLFNRRVFLIWCDEQWVRSRRTGMLFSVLMIDLDHFKQINDRFGHHVGDAVLCASVEKIQDAVRGVDVIARWGGEEFAALLPGANLEAALLVAERVRKNIENVSAFGSLELEKSNASTMNITACVGISTYGGPQETIQAMMQRADQALYRAKASGRNSVSAAYMDEPVS